MTRISKWRRRVVHWILGISSAGFLAFPASAETATLLCPVEDTSQQGWSFVVDLDYAARTISIVEMTRGTSHHQFERRAAVITDKMITFDLRDSSEPGWPEGTWFTTLVGSMDRLAGTLAVTETSFYKGRPLPENSGFVQARCRAATQKF